MTHNLSNEGAEGSEAQTFMLYDDAGRVVESGKVYELQLAVRDQPEDALCFKSNDTLYGGVNNEDPLVTCEIVDNIVYLKSEDKYLYIDDRAYIKRDVDLPEKDQRLRFVLTNNNAFHISLWDGELVAQLEYIKHEFGVIWFREDRPMELLLKRAQTFMLYDVEGRAVESGKKYELQLAGHNLDHDTLSFGFGVLHGVNNKDNPLLTCKTVDDIAYLKYEDMYVYIEDRYQIRFKVELPEKDERLRFVLTNNNTFHISLWDGELLAQLGYLSYAYGVVWFHGDDAMELLLKRVDS
ncbi:hypothetical protein EC991_009908 [Linnemannia zychae]|nr:hypothetical protein EC991_009908 [Linnemannia zychae]